MIRISNFSLDGGCGKTTTVLNLARHLAGMGFAVLCVDMDAKASLTSRMEHSDYVKGLINTGRNIASVLSGSIDAIDASVSISENFCFLGTEIPADGIEPTLPVVASRIQAKSPNHNRLHRALVQVDSFFDVCLIDCPPVASALTANIIYASDLVVSPVRLDEESITDTRNVIRMVAEIAELTDRKPKLAGLILTQTNPQTRLYKRTWPQVAALGVPILGEIRMFTGEDASRRILSSYAGIVSKIVQLIKEGAE